MYANPEQTILLPTAVPAKFDSNIVCIEPATVKEKSELDQRTAVNIIENDAFLEEPVSSSTLRKSNPPMLETSVTSSNRTSISECSLTSSSMCTQTTQLLSVNTPKKTNLRTHIRELKKKCKQLEESINANTKKISEMLKSVDHFNEAYQNALISDCGQLNIPPDTFFNYINELNNILIENFSSLSIEDKVGWKIKNLIDNIPFTHPCPNFNLEFLKNLFVRLRIFHTIKTLNKHLLAAPRKYKKLDILSYL